MVSILPIIIIGGILLIASSPSLQLEIAGFLARKQGEQIQRNILGGKLASDIAVEAGAGAVAFGEQFQKDVFGGLLIK